ncbi:MFS transporter [Rickettsiales endosymbiont of Stachyamoeba lipophora]|uniref:MFS transporter n=1 Tax=Rickettsiales endosymbiont of Stachyamoeba lipophora TaxID=2486578 RepID=UPI000F64FC46|nr:MFS transporter [Rickettsiales endosymbiont of Stachyamoeba lipophora]AZL15362.1 MFS transporter [Rickettsiales endosymbiont of Stachyamoeba lipophora]
MKKVLAAGMVGNALEWYDFALYGHFVFIISQLFFPSDNHLVSLVMTFGGFAAGFIMRPLGAVVFGHIGDQFGRRTALAAAILTMAIPTACIGLLPTYHEIGIAAPICLIIIRLLQGLSLGGEFSGSIAFIVEHAPNNRRGLAGSAAMFSMNVGILLGSLAAAICNNTFTTEALYSWGWRIPFIIGLAIGLVGLYVRSGLHESPKYEQAKKLGHISKTPTRELFKGYRHELFSGIVVYLTVTIPFFTFVMFMNTYMSKIVGKSPAEASLINTISMIIATSFIPVFGYLSDIFGRKVITRLGAGLFILLTYPLFIMLNQPGFLLPLIGQTIFGILVSLYMSPVPAILVELFPTSVRYSGVALSYNISAAGFGGTAPMVATFLINHTGNNYAIAFYIIFFAMISFAWIGQMSERSKLALA